MSPGSLIFGGGTQISILDSLIKMPEFSLIIPVYNSAQYFLIECLESCINQTFNDIEIICINDCSPDDSYKILENYAKKDSRIKIITHTQNRKQGGARNTGITAATGKYCWFIDNDDSILLNACEILYEVICKTHADIISFKSINYKYDIITKQKRIDYTGVLNYHYNTLFTKEDYTKFTMGEVEPWYYITCTPLLKNNKFRENVIYEDMDFTPILFSKANSIYVTNYTLYYRRIHALSITQASMDTNHIVNKILAMDVLYHYTISSDLPKFHFCTRILASFYSDLQTEYKKFPEIHTDEFDKMLKKASKFKKYFEGDTRLYNSIIDRYGNSQLLEFILKMYRFIIKRISQLKKAIDQYVIYCNTN
ncbi:glycosyl transferase [Spirochaetia bacterium]|nr:glycosyl transferase [Spirochaetia bacterium]